MRMMIGYVDNRPVYFNPAASVITVYGTWIMITGANTDNYMELAKKNLKNFSPL